MCLSATGQGSNSLYYYSLGGRLIGVLYGSETDELLTDAEGSVLSRMTTLPGSAVVKGNQVYSPYGSKLYSSGSMATNRGFTGQYKDATGLNYYNARYYDSVAGRFISADTVQGNLQGMDPYAYVGGNPETMTDPTGHCDGWCIAADLGIDVLESTSPFTVAVVDTGIASTYVNSWLDGKWPTEGQLRKERAILTIGGTLVAAGFFITALCTAKGAKCDIGDKILTAGFVTLLGIIGKGGSSSVDKAVNKFYDQHDGTDASSSPNTSQPSSYPISFSVAPQPQQSDNSAVPQTRPQAEIDANAKLTKDTQTMLATPQYVHAAPSRRLFWLNYTSSSDVYAASSQTVSNVTYTPPAYTPDQQASANRVTNRMLNLNM